MINNVDLDIGEFYLLSHQVVEEDMRSLGRQISNIEQELPQHVHQLILTTQETQGMSHLTVQMTDSSLIRSEVVCALQTSAYLSVAHC